MQLAALVEGCQLYSTTDAGNWIDLQGSNARCIIDSSILESFRDLSRLIFQLHEFHVELNLVARVVFA